MRHAVAADPPQLRHPARRYGDSGGDAHLSEPRVEQRRERRLPLGVGGRHRRGKGDRRHDGGTGRRRRHVGRAQDQCQRQTGGKQRCHARCPAPRPRVSCSARECCNAPGQPLGRRDFRIIGIPIREPGAPALHRGGELRLRQHPAQRLDTLLAFQQADRQLGGGDLVVRRQRHQGTPAACPGPGGPSSSSCPAAPPRAPRVRHR